MKTRCATIILLLLLILYSHTLAGNHSAFTFRSWEEMHWHQVVRQTNYYDCGPAAVATLIKIVTQVETVPPDTTTYTALAQLQALLATHNLPSCGLRMQLNGLLRYIEDYHLPVIAHILLPTPHFTVVSTAQAGRIITYDPALGRTNWEYTEWQNIWTGIALILWPLPLPSSLPSPLPASGYITDEKAIVERIQLITRVHWQGGIK